MTIQPHMRTLIVFINDFPLCCRWLKNRSCQVQTNPVNRIDNLPSFLMRLTGICDYPHQTNIRKFTALLDFCPHACYLSPLVCYSLTPNVEICRTVGYKSISRCSKNPCS